MENLNINNQDIVLKKLTFGGEEKIYLKIAIKNIYWEIEEEKKIL